jgi:hypothetical protein
MLKVSWLIPKVPWLVTVGEIVTESWILFIDDRAAETQRDRIIRRFRPALRGSLFKTDRSGTVWISKVVVSSSAVPPIAWACPSSAPRYTVLRASKLSG